MRRRLIVVLLSTAVCLLAVTSALAVKYNEAPMLRTMVAAGELPPVEERLPEEPCVYSAEWNTYPKGNVDFEIGRYGGTLRTLRFSPDWACDVFCLNNESLLGTPGIEPIDVRGSVLKDFEMSKDKKTFTFHMRKGLKWSDDVPVTTKDVLFVYEDFLLNKEITPVFPQYMKAANKVDGEPMKLKVIDDYTFQISFTKPYAAFPSWLSIIAWKGYTDLLKPKHYLKQFHPRYTPMEKLEPLIKKEGLSKGEWWTLFNTKDITNWELTNARAIGFPVLYPFIMKNYTPTKVLYERNPYYFKVDATGNQLPYIDRMEDTYVAQPEMHIMKVIAGEVDFLMADITTIQDVPLYKENAEKGGYRVLLELYYESEPSCLFLNQTYPDPVWRKIVRDVRFRKALSLAINRKEIVKAVYLGQFAEPNDLVPSEYNPGEANRLLDEMSLDKRDKEGYRLRPDGKRLVIPFETAGVYPADIPVLEFTKEYWEAVGIKVTIRKIDGGLWGTRGEANQIQATAMWSTISVPVSWGWAFSQGDINVWAWPLWWNWWKSAGETGEEPPADVKRLFELGDKSLVVSPEENRKVLDEFFRMLYDNVYWIETVKNVKVPLIVSKKFGNVPYKGYEITPRFGGEVLFFKE